VRSTGVIPARYHAEAPRVGEEIQNHVPA